MADNVLDFKEIIRKIEKNQILLPDFQREFVWRDEEQQKKIVASVLAKMPIGSILLLESKPDEYLSKVVGCKKTVEVGEIDEKVEFLLDGQQRITVLTNVFSNIIHDQCDKVSDLVSPSLKRRFFLCIPKWEEVKEETDWFGIKKLEFPYHEVDSEEPKFLSADIYEYVETITFFNGDKKPYNPQEKLNTALDDFCLTYDKGYLIPLYLLAPSDKKNREQTILRYKAIVEGVVGKIGKEILSYYVGLSSEEEKLKFMEEFIGDSEKFEEIKKIDNMDEKNETFGVLLAEKQEVWKSYMDEYLKSCIKNVSLNQIVVKEEQRARAIDIYENLNRGGVSLNTFDLIMARVAKVSNKNFFHRIIDYMHTQKQYSKSVLPQNIVSKIGNRIDENRYNATLETKCFNAKKNEISSKYIDAFLDVLSLYCHNPEFEYEEFKIEHMKRQNILSLEPTDIDNYCEKVCIALDRALFFFQTRCGIRNIQEINYLLMLVLVATIFMKEEYFNNIGVHKKLEAWYWSCLFSGEYSKDQNTTMCSNLKNILQTLNNERNVDWLISMKENALEVQNFSEKGFILMEKVEEDRYPKAVLKNFLCQFLLAKTYPDMFESNKTISVFCDEADELEAHHIIPLGTVKKVGESTKELRKNNKHVCNSPINFVYITKSANKEISDDSLEIYVEKICVEAKSTLHISSYQNASEYDEESKIKGLLENRFTDMQGDIKKHIMELLN